MILCLYVAGTFLLNNHVSSNIFVPFPAAILAFVTAVVSMFAYIWAPKKWPYQLALATYFLMCLTTGVLIELTGGQHSAYIPMWMMLAVFAGLFGFWGLGSVFVATNLSIVYHTFLSAAPYTREQIIIFFLAGEMPLLVSYLIWHEKNTQDQSKTKAYEAMAKELNQVANKSETVINSIAEGVVVTDGQGKIQLINPAAQTLLGWDKQDAMNLDYKSVITIGDSKGKALPENSSPISQMLVTNQSVATNDYSLTTHSGKKILISLLVSPVGDSSAGAIIVFRDITAEKEEERAKAEFISTASHEMRTPVAAIEGYLGLALNPSTAVIDDKARMFLEKAHESTQHLGRLFQDLLTVSRSEDGRLAPKPTVVDIVLFTKEIVDSLMPKAQSKGLFLVFKPNSSVAEEGSKVVSPVFYSYIDQDQLREVLNNLVDNAIKYTKQGNVTIDITGDETNITVGVTDTGIGVPPEDVTHLFQKFYRVDNSETREIGGTGLGLYISRRLIESNNGHIGVNSELGKGSTFYITIPRISHDRASELIQDAQQAATQQQSAPVAPIPGGTPVAPQPATRQIITAEVPSQTPPTAPTA
jgi:PAS domain S-box-containing protein